MDEANPNFKPTDNSICYGMAQNPSESLAMQLRLMMKDASPEDKCTLCKAAEALEKPSSSWTMWPSLMILMLMFGTDFNNPQTSSMMQAYLEALKKCNEEEQSEGETK